MRMNVLALLSVLFICSECGIAQTTAANSSASISGRVTIGGKAAVGISVVARVSDSPLENRTVGKTTTDEEGNYRLTGLVPGSVFITPIAKAYVVAAGEAYKPPGQSVNIAENESIKQIDFALVRGGVITGRITDLEGRPVISERVNVAAKGDSGNDRPIMMFPGGKNLTDDRGVYRIYGLGPGSYKVSIGQASAGGGMSIMGMGSSQYAKTYYPGVTEESKATVVEINEGTEATNIDITPGKPSRGFSVSGRVIDADSGQPVVSAFISYYSVNEASQTPGGMIFTGSQTDANGRFRLEGIESGHYAASTIMGFGQENSSYSDPTLFDVSEADVTGIEIKMRRGATIDGVAGIENNVDPAATALLQSVSLLAFVSERTKTTAPSYSRCQINPDGSFRLAGLSPGKVHIATAGFSTPPNGLQLLRTELDGVDQPDGIDLTPGAHITGVRLVFAYGTGKIRGEVKIEGGILPAGTRLMVSLHPAASADRKANRGAEVDSRGRFVVENLPPGTYELIVSSFVIPPVVSTSQGAAQPPPPFEQVTRTVTVENGAEMPLTIVINLTAKKAGPE